MVADVVVDLQPDRVAGPRDRHRGMLHLHGVHHLGEEARGEVEGGDVVAEEDLLAYRIPGDEFRRLLSDARFAAHFAAGLATRLEAYRRQSGFADGVLTIRIACKRRE